MQAVFTERQLVKQPNGTYGIKVRTPLPFDYRDGPGKGTKLKNGPDLPDGEVWLSVSDNGEWQGRPITSDVVPGTWEQFAKQGSNLLVSEVNRGPDYVCYVLVYGSKITR